MLNPQDFHELEQLINSGQYSDARHRVRGMLHSLQEAGQAGGNHAAQLAAELLTDTLDMLLYRHEAQITTSPVRAARLLCHPQPIAAPTPAPHPLTPQTGH